jgi:hypothetical protein
MQSPATVSWLKLPIIGMPGAECGRRLSEGGTTVVQEDFKEEYGPCDEPARWSLGMLLLCQEHAALVAVEFGDDIAGIEDAWREECL